MGCNCKKTAKAADKYSAEETLITLKGFGKVGYIIRQVITILLISIVFIIGTPLFIIFSIIRMVRGKGTKINLTKIIKVFHVRE